MKTIGSLDFINDPKAYDNHEELKSMLICCEAIVTYGERYASKARGNNIIEKLYMDYIRIGGTLLNLKFAPAILEDQEEIISRTEHSSI